MNSVDNIMKAIRLLDLDNQPDTTVDTKDLVALVNEIVIVRREATQLSRELYRAEVRASNAIADGLAIMAESVPRLDVLC